MNTIFWLSVVICFFSAVFIVLQFVDYAKMSPLERIVCSPRVWMYPSFILSMVVSLTI